MITQKHTTKIIIVIMAAAVCFCLFAIVFAEKIAKASGGAGIAMEYESRLFDTSETISINLIMDEEDWEDMLANAIAETYYQCDVEIGGEMIRRVGVRPKGNTSLTAIARDPDTDRYSLKLEFDHYVDGQTCFGLDKLILNNNYADATNMKEALIYDMYQYLDADASLYNYAELSVNGEYWGVYLALEAVEDSFLLRNYGTKNGELYKPDSMDMGQKGDSGFGNSDFDPLQFDKIQPQAQKDEDAFPINEQNNSSIESGSAEQAAGKENVSTEQAAGKKSVPTSKHGGFGGVSMGGNGANLNYIDQELDSYTAIWDGEVTNSAKSDHTRVVKALEHISEGLNLEKYMDIENLLKYMAVHVFSVNEDSLLGRMAHNYYLYESDGRLNILPWDYNLAFGGMGERERTDGESDATSAVNYAIDYAFSGTNFFDAFMEDEEYHAKYYSYLKQLVEEYVYGGGFDAFYQRTRSQIDSLVESDPTAFYTGKEYKEAADTLYETVQLRSQSISGQIEGSIPSTEEEQKNSDTLIDASHLDLSVMGSMSMGDRIQNWNENEKTEDSPFNGNESPENIASAQFEIDDGSHQAPKGGMGNMPNVNIDRNDLSKTALGNLSLYGVSFLAFIGVLVFAIAYHRRSRRFFR